MTNDPKERPGPLAGMRVIDVSTVVAGPLTAMLLGDFGADVIKVEHPVKGDALRGHGYSKDGAPLWWKMMSRNKRSLTLYLGKPEGQEIFRRLCKDADVVIENFRPGTLERWNLGYEELKAINPDLILLRTTGFGQHGPMSHRPGFGTIAEAMSGFAYLTGQADGPPTLPPMGLADGIAGLAGAYAVMLALWARKSNGGQEIDLAIIEPILTIIGPQPTVYRALGIVGERHGNRSMYNSPRNIYETSDGRYLALSTSAHAIAERVMHLVGRPELIEEDWFQSGGSRAQHADILDDAVGSWIRQRTRDEVIKAFDEAQAAVAPINDISDIMTDPQYAALNTIIDLPDKDLGTVAMQNVMFRLMDTPGGILHTGPDLGEHNQEILKGELGLTDADLEDLRSKGVVL